ncbi:MAG: citrate (Si)-synthase, partial [Betaproteobacteria bacterium]|nr:citrate (Si)-synthase [Betaproteobacteria bacterium]
MSMAESKTATIQIDTTTEGLEFPVLSGTIGPDVVDIRSLTGKTGVFTFDPGFMATASCKSRITYIDGDEGVLLYRGYPIEQLAVHCDF